MRAILILLAGIAAVAAIACVIPVKSHAATMPDAPIQLVPPLAPPAPDSQLERAQVAFPCVNEDCSLVLASRDVLVRLNETNQRLSSEYQRMEKELKEAQAAIAGNTRIVKCGKVERTT